MNQFPIARAICNPIAHKGEFGRKGNDIFCYYEKVSGFFYAQSYPHYSHCVYNFRYQLIC